MYSLKVFNAILFKVKSGVKIKMHTKWSSSGNVYTTWNYKKVYKNEVRYSAGILPYTFDQEGKCMFLLGKDHENDWSDFGGRCEFRDKSEPIATATREFYEETLGAVLSVQECTEKLNINPVQIVSKTLNGSPYYMYLMYIDYNNYTETFHKVANFLKYQFDSQETSKIIEKNTIRWVSMDTMLMCIEPNQRNTPLRLRGVFYKTMVAARDQIQFLIK
jgi:hypothetical protein